jgi:hypothetical protein
VLGQDNASKVNRQLLKPFKSGEPRMQELEIEESKAILQDAVSRAQSCMTVNGVGFRRLDFRNSQ